MRGKFANAGRMYASIAFAHLPPSATDEKDSRSTDTEDEGRRYYAASPLRHEAEVSVELEGM